MNIKVNGRTPEEIKKGLEHCVKLTVCSDCPYSEDKNCDGQLFDDALAYIQQLERERDAAVKDILKASLVGCHVCKHYYRPDQNVRKYACRIFGNFDEHDFIADDGSICCGAMEWRGVQEVE